MKNDLENTISKNNEFFFFREFSYSKNKFSPEPKNEYELADHVVWLDDLLITYQVKERHEVNEINEQTEISWFENKVIKKAKKQISDTVKYLNKYSKIEIENERGHRFNIATASITNFDKIICYNPHDLLPSSYKQIKHYLSSKVGFIHILQLKDYIGICKTLITPYEVHEYLVFREKIIKGYELETRELPEQAMVGQYLIGDLESKPSIHYFQYLLQLDGKYEDWDMLNIIHKFGDRITNIEAFDDYYRIITEIAKLQRNELTEFKKRFMLSIEKSTKNEFVLPYRISIPRTECGYVFIPIIKEMAKDKLQALQNFTYAHKYDQKIKKCIGISFLADNNGYYDIDWCFMESEWIYNQEMEEFLKNNYPFREVKETKLPLYFFKP